MSRLTNFRVYAGFEVVEIDGEFYTLNGWQGESWCKSWRVIPNENGYCENADDTEYDIYPIYAFETEADFDEDDDNQFEIVGYKLR